MKYVNQSPYQSLTYPGIFEVVKNPNSDDFMLQYKEHKYEMPGRLYGDTGKFINFYWTSFEKYGYTGGLLLTGQKGSGKTLISSALSNKAIDRGLRVIEITNITFSAKLLRFLDELDGVILFFDEFGKNFNSGQQDKMLTLLSNINGKERIVLITENEPRRISQFIRNRPGRVKYSLHFNKLPLKIVEEYCAEKKIDVNFYNEFVTAYKTVLEFQFDHLQAIVSEHLDNPTMGFDALVELLNIDGVTGTKVVHITNVIDIETDEAMEILSIDEDYMELNLFERGASCYVTYTKPKASDKEQDQRSFDTSRKSIMINKKALTEMVDDRMVFETKGMRILAKIERN